MSKKNNVVIKHKTNRLYVNLEPCAPIRFTTIENATHFTGKIEAIEETFPEINWSEVEIIYLPPEEPEDKKE